MNAESLDLTVEGVSVRLACLRKDGARAPLVCLHGFGSTKEDYADLSMRPEFQDRRLILWDAPGFGASEITDPDALSIPLLVQAAMLACDALNIESFHLSGHSMGGLTALFMAHEHPDRVRSFINVEGNIAPEDCFLSRQIIDHPAETPGTFAKGFVDRVRQLTQYGSMLYAASLPLKVRDTSFKPIFTSMVALSDEAALMEMFTNLTCPRCFIYGEQNSHLSYLGDLPSRGVEVIEVPHSGHFPMYSNPPALWGAMADFLERHDP